MLLRNLLETIIYTRNKIACLEIDFREEIKLFRGEKVAR
jgi:hypothetical protein